ncbi:HNH endonuclease [Agrococcus sp. DT81.2]|uniref:HNH endonuclease n=1 Tax=Agrococcus sp. DT81.2 TaxID=3393414 RepID=UPI003CE46C28
MTWRDDVTVWLVASRGRTFDSDGAFAVRDEIDWSETGTARIGVGDVVLLYGTRPVSALTHMCRVVATGIPFSSVIDDREFWLDPEALRARETRSWMRLRLERTFTVAERQALSLHSLREHGLNAAVQGRRRAPAGVLQIVRGVIDAAASRVNDALAETSDIDLAQVDEFRSAIARGDFRVADKVALWKTRGSAQRAFSEAVKRNYGYQCALTGIRTREFLVASHIVPWAEDWSIRLDPSNGICLSTLVDRAFDTGYLSIDQSRRAIVHHDRLRHDPQLLRSLEAFDGQQLASPTTDTPRVEYIVRRLASRGGTRP